MEKRKTCPVCNKPFAVFNIMPDGRNQYVHRATTEKGRQFVTSHYTREIPVGAESSPARKKQPGDIIAERLWLYWIQSEVNYNEALKQLIIQASNPITEENYSLSGNTARKGILSIAERKFGTTYERAYIRMKLALKLNQEEVDCLRQAAIKNHRMEDMENYLGLAATFISECRIGAAKNLGLDPLIPFQSL